MPRLVSYISVDDRRPLDSIAKLCRESLRIEKALTEQVLAAREQGHSWTDIGGGSARRSSRMAPVCPGALGERYEENEAITSQGDANDRTRRA